MSGGAPPAAVPLTAAHLTGSNWEIGSKRNVRFGSPADIAAQSSVVHFSPESGH